MKDAAAEPTPSIRPRWDLPLSPAGLEVDLSNGARVRVRPISPKDLEGLHAAYQRFSDESRYLRFMSPLPRLGERLAASLTNVDDLTQFAWAVFDPSQPSEVDDESGLAIASARLFVDADDPTTAEASLSVVDDYQRHGLGHFLIEMLLATAAQVDITRIRFEVLYENRPMLKLLHSFDAETEPIEGDRSVAQCYLTVPSVDDIDVPMGALYMLIRLAMENLDESTE